MQSRPRIQPHKRALPLPDLHHLVTAYRTHWVGMAEIGEWELRGGCDSLITYFLNRSGVVIGLFLAPHRVWRAFQEAKRQRTQLNQDFSKTCLPPRAMSPIP